MEVLDEHNKLRGCTSAKQDLPGLAVVCQLLPYLQQLGVTIFFKIDGQLRHCKNPTEEELMRILL